MDRVSWLRIALTLPLWLPLLALAWVLWVAFFLVLVLLLGCGWVAKRIHGRAPITYPPLIDWSK